MCRQCDTREMGELHRRRIKENEDPRSFDLSPYGTAIVGL